MAKAESDPKTTSEPSGAPDLGLLQAISAKLDAAERAAAAREDAAVQRALQADEHSARATAELGERLDILGAQLAELQVRVDASTRGFMSLQAIVVNALPSRLLRLTTDHINLLREKAPTAKVRLISPFKAGLMDLREGHVMEVTDHRVKVHGESMHLGLVLDAGENVDEIVRRLVDEQVRELARLEDEKRQLDALAQLTTAEAHAAELRKHAGR